jgi:hypothetical protein
MEKVSQNASTLKPLGPFKTNCPTMSIGGTLQHFGFFYVDRKSKMVTTAGDILTLDILVWENVQMLSSQKLEISMLIVGQFVLNGPSGFRVEAF